MFGRILLFLVLIPLVELVLLSQLLHRTGLMLTLAVVFVTGIVGVNLARRQGSLAWRAIHQQMSSGKTPSKEILDGVLILFAGVFLITPGLLTDIVGFSLLVPRLRTVVGTRLVRWFMTRTTATFQSVTSPAVDDFDDDPTEKPTVRVVDPNKL